MTIVQLTRNVNSTLAHKSATVTSSLCFNRKMTSNIIRIVGLLLFLPVLALAQAGTFYVKGRTLFTPDGEEVIFRGVNKMIFYNDRNGDASYREIAKTGANVVRIFWFTSGTAAEMDTTITNAIRHHLIPIIAVWEATGKWGAPFQQCVDYWRRPDIAAVIQKHQRYLILNIANEAGNGSQSTKEFENVYTLAVRQLRDAGLKVPLMIDAAGWGRQEAYIFSAAKSLIKSDPLHNLVFSWHPWDANAPESRIKSACDLAITNDIPFVIGEFAHKSVGCACCIPYRYILSYTQLVKIGWLAWEWGPGNADCHEMDMTTDNTFEGLHGWGLEVAVTDPNSIKKTSKRPLQLFAPSSPR